MIIMIILNNITLIHILTPQKNLKTCFLDLKVVMMMNILKPKKMNLLNEKNLMCIVRLITKDRNTQLGDGYLVKT